MDWGLEYNRTRCVCVRVGPRGDKGDRGATGEGDEGPRGMQGMRGKTKRITTTHHTLSIFTRTCSGLTLQFVDLEILALTHYH